METTNIVDFARRDELTDALTDLLRAAAQQLIATAVEAELASYMSQFTDLRTETGHAAVVRNGHHPARPFQTSLGAALCAQTQDVGSRLAMALSQRGFQRRDAPPPLKPFWALMRQGCRQIRFLG
jgi:hypothetical protein